MSGPEYIEIEDMLDHYDEMTVSVADFIKHLQAIVEESPTEAFIEVYDPAYYGDSVARFLVKRLETEEEQAVREKNESHRARAANSAKRKQELAEYERLKAKYG